MDKNNNIPVFSAARVQSQVQNFSFLPKEGPKRVGFVKGMSCCGQKKDGPQTAPPLVCSEAMLEVVRDLNWEPMLLDAPQVFRPTPPEAEALTRAYQPFCVFATCDLVRDKCDEARKAGAFPLLIGGDHCLAMGSIASAITAHPNIGVLWFDAHADVNTPETSPSGNMHGMPLAALLDLPGIRTTPGFEHRYPVLKPERVAYIGLRDVDEGEKEVIAKLGLSCAFYVDDLKKHGMRALMDQVLAKLCPNNEPVHLSFDVDGMDPIDAPSTGTPVADGVRLHEALEMIAMLRATGNLASADCVEVNPSLGTDEDVRITVANAQVVIAHLLGRV